MVPILALLASLTCEADQVTGPGVVASLFRTVGLGCVAQVTPMAKPALLYREFWHDERGRFMVFVSVPGDDPNLATGSRSYFLFPRKRLPSVALGSEGELVLHLTTGQDATFDAADARLRRFPGEFREATAINLDNRGGFEIESFPGIRLDAGWKVGTQAYRDPQASSEFFDASNRRCELRNEEFFFYENTYYGEPNVRFPEDASLADFLGKRCPGLDLSPLRR